MKATLNDELISIANQMSADEAEQLHELFTYYVRLDRLNRLEILQHAKLYHDAVQLMKPAE